MNSHLSSTIPLLVFKQLACYRDNRCLFAGLNFTINRGDIVHIEGANGTGKTTLLRALTGLLPEYDGNIEWLGQSIQHQRYDFSSQLLFIGHSAGVNTALTPRENLAFLCQLHSAVTIQAIDAALAEVGLYGYEDMLGYQLSAGQHRRVALARLYLTQATVWVLDEPYTALDAEGVKKLELRFEQHAKAGGCVILTSHQQPSISSLKRLSLSQYTAMSSNADLTGEAGYA